jgi:hypothetical protein
MSVGSILVAFALHPFFDNLALRVLLTMVIMMVNIVLIWFVALSKSQRESFVNIIHKKKNKHA